MIKVEHQYHYLKPDKKLSHRWDVILCKAVAAKRFGDTATYNKFYDIVSSEYNTWKSNADLYSKENSHTNWLGGGKGYIVEPCNPLDSLYTFEQVIQNLSEAGVIKFLQDIERDNSWSLSNPM